MDGGVWPVNRAVGPCMEQAGATGATPSAGNKIAHLNYVSSIESRWGHRRAAANRRKNEEAMFACSKPRAGSRMGPVAGSGKRQTRFG